MVLVYKNLLIIEREDKNKYALNFYKHKSKVWFNDGTKFFQYKSKKDLLIIVYDMVLSQDREMKVVNWDKFSNMNMVGNLKIYRDRNHFKISDCKFLNDNVARQYLTMFKEFIILYTRSLYKSSYGLNRIGGVNLHWDVHNSKALDIIREAGLMNLLNKDYNFSSREVYLNWFIPNMGGTSTSTRTDINTSMELS